MKVGKKLRDKFKLTIWYTRPIYFQIISWHNLFVAFTEIKLYKGWIKVMATVWYFWHGFIHRSTAFIYLQYSHPPLFITFSQMFGRHRTPSMHPSLLMSRAHSPTFLSFHLHHSSFSNPSIALPTSQLILQPFRCLTYVTAHSPIHLFASTTSQALHLRHLASHPWCYVLTAL